MLKHSAPSSLTKLIRAGFPLAAFLFVAAVAGVFGESSALSTIRAEKYTLKNGLQVILQEDHSAPIVAVNIYYHVGSKNENPGRTGFAHLFEHLMFEGSEHRDANFSEPLQKLGADSNGFTTCDVTGYYEVVPRNALELVLWMESDRLGFLLPAVTQKKLDTQRDVVKNEKRQRYDNQPYGEIEPQLSAALYPPEHPYHWTTIGSMEDLTAASLDDVKDFFRRFYTPNNATMCLVGDFDSAEAKNLIEQYFGSLPTGPNPPRMKAWPVGFDAEKRVKLYDRVELPRLVLTWHTVPAFDPDEAALEILASILSATPASRLDRRLVHEEQIVQSITVYQESLELAGRFSVSASPRPGHTLEEIQSGIDAELARIRATPPTADEVQRAKNAIEAAFVKRLQSAHGRAEQFTAYNVFCGDPNFSEKDLARFLRVTTEDVQRVAAKYLTANRVVLTVEPQDRQQPSDEPGAVPLDRSKEPPLGPMPSAQLPKVQKFQLANGLEVRVVERHNLPLVNFNLVIKSGATSNPLDRAGLASVTASLMRRGTTERDAMKLDDELQSLGTDLDVTAGWNNSGISMQTLSKHLDASLDIFTDVLLSPAFTQDDFDHEQQSRLTSLTEQRSDPESTLWKAYANTLYGPKHPYGLPMEGTEESLAAITREELRRFHDTYYRPNNAVLIVVGDVQMDSLRPRLEKAFAAWKPADVPRTELLMPGVTGKRLVVLGDKPGAAQSVIVVGGLGPERKSPEFFSLVLANSMVGGSYMGRLNQNLRQDKGYTYGASAWFDFRRGSSPFAAYAPVDTSVTKEAVAEMVEELKASTEHKPLTESELAYAKDTIVRSFVRELETAGDIAGLLENLVRQELPDGYYDHYVDALKAVTLADTQRMAKKYFDPAQMVVFVVGDLKVIEPKLRELNLGEIRYVDPTGKFINPPQSTKP